jgi:hypothetical protein
MLSPEVLVCEKVYSAFFRKQRCLHHVLTDYYAYKSILHTQRQNEPAARRKGKKAKVQGSSDRLCLPVGARLV